MRNYLMTLGWAPSGESEIVPWERIVAEFRLEDVVPSPAFFDVKKLTAFNGEYLRALPVEEFIEACQPWLTGPSTRPGRRTATTRDVFAAIAPLVQTAGHDAGRGAPLRRLPLPGRAARATRRRGPRP